MQLNWMWNVLQAITGQQTVNDSPADLVLSSFIEELNDL
jgi:hypothetical protein